MSFKSWILVLNNYTDEDHDQWVKILTNEEIVTRCVVGREIGEETKTPHFQGAVTFRSAKRLAALKKLLGHRIHAEKLIATEDWSYHYKGDNFIDVNFKKQGKRGDLARICEMAKEGSTVREIATEFPGDFIRYHSGIRALVAEVGPAKKTECLYELGQFTREPVGDVAIRPTVLWGPSGYGKTEFALAHFENPHLIRHLDDIKSFRPGTHDALVFDDMSFTHLHKEAQIHILDWNHPSTIHARYANAVIPARTPRVFTTNVEDGAIFDIDYPAIKRRVSIVHIDEKTF